MSDYHIMYGDENANAFLVVYHLSVPDADNLAGTNYRTAIVEWQGGTPVQSVLPNIGTEQTALDAGSIYEVTETFYSNPTETEPEKQASLDARYAVLQTLWQSRLQNMLSYWGYERTIP